MADYEKISQLKKFAESIFPKAGSNKDEQIKLAILDIAKKEVDKREKSSDDLAKKLNSHKIDENFIRTEMEEYFATLSLNFFSDKGCEVAIACFIESCEDKIQAADANLSPKRQEYQVLTQALNTAKKDLSNFNANKKKTEDNIAAKEAALTKITNDAIKDPKIAAARAKIDEAQSDMDKAKKALEDAKKKYETNKQ